MTRFETPKSKELRPVAPIDLPEFCPHCKTVKMLPLPGKTKAGCLCRECNYFVLIDLEAIEALTKADKLQRSKPKGSKH